MPQNDLISRSALMEQVKAIHNAVDASAINNDYNTGFHSATSQIMGLIAYAPAVERPKGRWEWNNGYGFYNCSECKAISPREDQDGEYIDCPNFCHECGADMREDAG